jgi:hypothetical protein
MIGYGLFESAYLAHAIFRKNLSLYQFDWNWSYYNVFTTMMLIYFLYNDEMVHFLLLTGLHDGGTPFIAESLATRIIGKDRFDHEERMYHYRTGALSTLLSFNAVDTFAMVYAWSDIIQSQKYSFSSRLFFSIYLIYSAVIGLYWSIRMCRNAISTHYAYYDEETLKKQKQS